jgi:hypothetical protein
MDIALLGAAAVAAYVFIIKPGLTNLGLTGTDPVIVAQMNVPAAQNPFNYQFQPFIDFYNDNTPSTSNLSDGGFFSNVWSDLTMQTVQASGNPTIQQFFNYCQQNKTAPSPWGYLNTADLTSRAEQLNSALSVGMFDVASNQAAGMSALSGLSSQLQVAFIANYFWWNFQSDLLTFLNGSLVKSGLTQANLVQVINNVNSLPVS